MIRALSGEVLAVEDRVVLLDVNGIGFEIQCSREVISHCQPGDRMRIVTYLQISEAGIALFGFANERERELFLKITTIKGIGGKTGITALSILSVSEIVKAVALEDTTAFLRVPGVGRKTAERICFELKSLLPAELTLTQEEDFAISPSASSVVETVTEALASLGFTCGDAQSAFRLVKAARGEKWEELDEETLLRLALKELQRR
jgi:Holliday junction DNA helicase RuvA